MPSNIDAHLELEAHVPWTDGLPTAEPQMACCMARQTAISGGLTAQFPVI